MKPKDSKVADWLSKNNLRKTKIKDNTTRWATWLKMKIPSMPGDARMKDAQVFNERNKRFRRCVNRIIGIMEKRYKLEASNSALKHLAEAGTKSFVQSIRFELFVAAKEKEEAEGLPEESSAFEIEQEIEKFTKNAKLEIELKKVTTISYKERVNKLDPGYKKKLFVDEME